MRKQLFTGIIVLFTQICFGQTKSITFPAKITVGDAEVAVESEFSINRKDFGIVYAGKTDDLIRDDVVIRLNLKSPRKK